MLRHNLLLFYRSVVRDKSTFLINLFGLCAGLTCTLLIYLWINDELSVDKFHAHDDRLFQMMLRSEGANGIQVGPVMAPVLSQTLSDEFPEVEYAVMEARLPITYTLLANDKVVKEEGMYAGEAYFRVFSYYLLQGSVDNVLTGVNSIAISLPLAHRLFNTDENVIGKMVTLQDKGELMVTGVFSVPSNSSYQFDFILPFALQFTHYPNLKNDWSNSWAYAYVRLKEGTDATEFNRKIKDLVKQKSGQEAPELFATRYADGYLYGDYENGVQSGGRIAYVRMFALLAIFIVIIACVNFMNLSTARASRRLKEIGVKKVVGVSRSAMIGQYIGESMLTAIVAACLSLGLIALLLPEFNSITGKSITLGFDAKLMAGIAAITLVTGLVAGSYPALYLSRFNPIAVLKSRVNTSTGEVFIRKGLIAFQFVLSVSLITCVAVIYHQIDLIQNQNPGYNKDNVIYFEREGKTKEHLEAFLSEIKNIPGVINASSTFLTFFGDLNSTQDISWEGKDSQANLGMQYRRVNYGMIELLDIKMKAGSAFSPDVTSAIPKVVFNETAVKMMGLTDPIGKTVTIWGNAMEIAGVTEDFHFESLHERVKPLFFLLNPERTNMIMVRLEAGKVDETIARLKAYYREFNGGMPLDFRFLDEKFQGQYIAEKRVASVSQYFAGLAIVISCLGLYGLVMFTAERKTREIGIRKTLGSGRWQIVYFLSAGFTRIVLAAIVIAIPLSYWASRHWLESFAYRVDLKWWWFGASGLAALLIAWLTMGVQAVKAANLDPVKCLRSE